MGPAAIPGLGARIRDFGRRGICLLPIFAKLVQAALDDSPAPHVVQPRDGSALYPVVFIQQTPCLEPVSSCYSSTQTILASISIVGCFFYVALCLILTATFYARDPQSDNPIARPSSRNSLLHLLVKLALTISFLAFKSMPRAKWFLIILFTFGVGSVAWMNTWV